MCNLFFNVFLNITPAQFINIFYAFLLMPLLLFVIILGFTIYKIRMGRQTKLWQESIVMLISESIFISDEDEPVDVANKYNKLMQIGDFRQCLINEIITIKKGLSGASTDNLVKLYENLSLNHESYGKLKAEPWHIKAKGIQELALMDQKKYVKEIFKLTNDTNELVRNEAQCALICFYGFPGLRFLNVTVYPISQLQQIQLLNALYLVKGENFEDIKRWMESAIESVIEFALKLATFYNCYQVYDQVIESMQNPNLQIKLSALAYLKNLPQEDSPSEIIKTYSFESKTYKLAILDTLKIIGSEEQVPFLLQQLQNEDDDIKSAAAKSLSQLHPIGAAFFQSHVFADQLPWKNIFLQNMNERAA